MVIIAMQPTEIFSEMARPDGVEPPTAWFVVLQLKRDNLLYLLKYNDFFYPILFVYIACNALIRCYLVPSIG